MIESGNPGAKAEPKARVFISYSRKDMDFADQLEAALKTRGFEPLIDRTEIYAFEDWWRRIQALIIKADTVIFALSPDAISSPTCQKEVAFAASLNKRFAPIVWRSVDVANVPIELSRLNFISFEDEAQFESNADKLADALCSDVEWIRKHTEFGELADAGGKRIHDHLARCCDRRHWRRPNAGSLAGPKMHRRRRSRRKLYRREPESRKSCACASATDAHRVGRSCADANRRRCRLVEAELAQGAIPVAHGNEARCADTIRSARSLPAKSSANAGMAVRK
jgi:hypothetical protein